MELLYPQLTREIMDCAFKVHSFLGPGLLESSYEECMYYEILSRELRVEKQKPMPLIYEKVKLEIGYRLDLIVENKVIVEIKSVDCLNPIEAPRRKQRGIFDPDKTCFICSLTPPQAAGNALAGIHTAQLLTYLRLSECKIGFLMNFNVESMKDGIKRYIL